MFSKSKETFWKDSLRKTKESNFKENHRLINRLMKPLNWLLRTTKLLISTKTKISSWYSLLLKGLMTQKSFLPFHKQEMIIVRLIIALAQGMK